MTSPQSLHQVLLKIPIVFDLCSRALKGSESQHHSNKREIVNVSGTYYIRDSKDNLTKIQPGAKGLDNHMNVIFTTFKYYIDHVDDPYAIIFHIHPRFICRHLLGILYHMRPSVEGEQEVSQEYIENSCERGCHGRCSMEQEVHDLRKELNDLRRNFDDLKRLVRPDF